MWKNRMGYILTIALLLGLVFFFSNPYLLCAAGIRVFLALHSGLAIRRECHKMEIKMELGAGTTGGGEVPFRILLSMKKSPWFLRYLEVEIEKKNKMFQTTERKRFLLSLAGQENCFESSEYVPLCGEVEISCRSVKAYDFLKLFVKELETPAPVSTVVYPKRKRLQVRLSRSSAGVSKDTGMIQNRRGNDPSEIFDLREYTPGDDIRSIHWKLSSKTENLILRQASDPVHYNMVLMPDFGQNQLENKKAAEQINAVMGYAIALGEELLRQRVVFGVAFPTTHGLRLYEVQSEQEFQRITALWLGLPLQEMSGTGLRYFEMNHMEERFTKLMLFTAGEDMPNAGALNGKIHVSVIAATETDHVKATSAGTCERIELPAEQQAGECEQIIC